ncbi:hypothetical protein AK812_SmicGene46295 [Symbiodinium microadriaticum]|uniref:Uncharacterized protein n=1 Tax=Symbiodinium microadriaticum TaxID=2951 RepID=A0A1Q9BU67_SYMMI|nr:hypothetical protein AK812_SmicGene46295 [Symbiodinium microadriaticum]
MAFLRIGLNTGIVKESKKADRSASERPFINEAREPRAEAMREVRALYQTLPCWQHARLFKFKRFVRPALDPGNLGIGVVTHTGAPHCNSDVLLLLFEVLQNAGNVRAQQFKIFKVLEGDIDACRTQTSQRLLDANTKLRVIGIKNQLI